MFDLTLVDADGTSGTSDTIGVTGYHKVYTEDRGWGEADALTQGELVRGDHGDVTVAAVTRQIVRNKTKCSQALRYGAPECRRSREGMFFATFRPF